MNEVKKEELIRKWLDHELSQEELKTFKTLDEFSAYTKLSEKAKAFKAPDFDIDASLKALESKTNRKKQPVFRIISTIAAVLVLGFFVFKTIQNNSGLTSIQTDVALTEQINLPDKSIVSLNSNSTLDYNSADWNNKRELNLNGEALFKVEKGEKFSVSTAYGKVSVLGTVFNIKSRDYTFQVTCFEGSVEVKIDSKSYILKQNDYLYLDNNKVVLEKNMRSIPSWQENLTIIKNKSLDEVIKELQNYYDLEFDSSDIDTSKRFTGSFNNVNINLALNSITLPLGLSYKIEGKTVILGN